MIVVAATKCMDAIPDYLQWPGRLEREVVVQTPDLGKKLELLRGMLLSPLMAGRTHDDNKPTMDDNDNRYNIFDNKAGLWEVANACVSYIAANLLALVRRAATLGIKEALGRGLATQAAVTAAPG